MRRITLLALWIATDMLCFLATYTLAYFLRVGFIISSDFPLHWYLQTTIIVAPLWVLVMAELGVFRLLRVQGTAKNISYLFFSAVLGLSLFSLAYYFLFGRFFSRLLLVLAGVLSFIGVVIWHLAFDQWQRRLLRRGSPAFPALIVGTNRDAERFLLLLQERMSPITPVAILDPQGSPKKDIGGIPVIGKLNKLEEAIARCKPKYLIQCSNLEHTINMLSVCRNHRMTYLLLPSVLGAAGQREEMVTIEGQPMAMIRE